VSYILDALKKAAEQRSGPPPEVRRLLSPAPVTAASPTRYVTLAVAAAGVVAAAAVVWMWPAAHDVPAPAATPVAAGINPPQRWAFINGRKYVEGDVIGDGSARVEEIQSTGVVIAEDGRRTTLRP